MVSLKDVAKRAGVSATTVSRVLNGNNYVTTETKTKVLEAVASLNYKPNAIAQSLRSSKTHTIGVLVPDASNPYFMRLVRSLEDYSRSFGYSILLASSDENVAKEIEMLSILETRTDAVVLATGRSYVQNSNLSDLADYRIPIILIDRELETANLPTVVEENERSTYELIQHVIQLGHRRIGMVTSSVEISTVVLRQLGYEKALRDAGLEVRSEFIERGTFDQHTGYLACKRLLSRGEARPTALFCANNSITIGALIAVKELKFTIPNDISIVSFGEIPFPELISPPITSVVQGPERVGQRVGEILIANLLDGSLLNDRIVLPTHIRLGSSVRPLMNSIHK